MNEYASTFPHCTIILIIPEKHLKFFPDFIASLFRSDEICLRM